MKQFIPEMPAESRLYIKSSHKKDIITAYDNHEINLFTNELQFEDKTISDNINLIEATNYLLDAVNVLETKESISSKVDFLSEKLIDLFSIVLTNQKSHPNFHNYIMNRSVRMEWGYLENFMYDENRFYFIEDDSRDKIVKIDRFNHNIKLKKWEQDGYKMVKYSSKNTPESRLNNMQLLSQLLIDAYEAKDTKKIYDVCVDFMQTHILPNANVRVSQVIMNVFFMALNQYPPSMIYESEFFGQVNSNISCNRLKIYTELTKMKLNIIKSEEYNILNVLTEDLTLKKGKEPS